MDPSAADALLRLGLIIAFVVMWAILAGLLARWKNRQRSFWIVMSFLFGPFALLILLLLPRKPLPGMKAVECPGCEAKQNVPEKSPTYEWREADTDVGPKVGTMQARIARRPPHRGKPLSGRAACIATCQS